MSPLKPETLVKGLGKLAKVGGETELWWWHDLGIRQLTSPPTQLNEAEVGQIPPPPHTYIHTYTHTYIHTNKHTYMNNTTTGKQSLQLYWVCRDEVAGASDWPPLGAAGTSKWSWENLQTSYSASQHIQNIHTIVSSNHSPSWGTINWINRTTKHGLTALDSVITVFINPQRACARGL